MRTIKMNVNLVHAAAATGALQQYMVHTTYMYGNIIITPMSLYLLCMLICMCMSLSIQLYQLK